MSTRPWWPTVGHIRGLTNIYELEYFRDKQSLLLLLQGVLRSGNPGPLLLRCMMTVKRRAVVALLEGACSFQPGPILTILHCSKNPRWGRKMPFLLRVYSYLSSTMIIGTWSISNVSVEYLLYSFFFVHGGGLLINITCLASISIWVWACWFWCFYHHGPEFYSWLSTEDPAISSPSSFFPFSFKKER